MTYRGSNSPKLKGIYASLARTSFTSSATAAPNGFGQTR